MQEDYKVLVTVGTTSFDGLISYLDIQSLNGFLLTMQIGPGHYLPKNHKYFRFDYSLPDHYSEYDVIITHAGAGTVFSCLERGLKLIVVPNLERLDPHQLELSNYLEKKNYALVAKELTQVQKLLEIVHDFQPTTYKSKKFFKVSEIRSFLINALEAGF